MHPSTPYGVRSTEVDDELGSGQRLKIRLAHDTMDRRKNNCCSMISHSHRSRVVKRAVRW